MMTIYRFLSLYTREYGGNKRRALAETQRHREHRAIVSIFHLYHLLYYCIKKIKIYFLIIKRFDAQKDIKQQLCDLCAFASLRELFC